MRECDDWDLERLLYQAALAPLQTGASCSSWLDDEDAWGEVSLRVDDLDPCSDDVAQLAKLFLCVQEVR